MPAKDLTDDGFLDGRLQLLQPRDGFRSGVDAVLLAASVPAKPGQSILEIGCGAGAALLCLAARVGDLALTGLEVQETYADLARQNAARNQFDARIFLGDLTAIPAALRDMSFDHVVANPPYYTAGSHSPAEDQGRARALGETASLTAWLDAATRRLKPQGRLTIIQKADRLRDLIDACDSRLGSLEIKPIAPRMGHAAALIILRARKSGRAAPVLHAPLIMHEGTQHQTDADTYTQNAKSILRDAAALIL